MSEPAAGVMRMSADDDDQADQQLELADLCMAETDHPVLKVLKSVMVCMTARLYDCVQLPDISDVRW